MVLLVLTSVEATVVILDRGGVLFTDQALLATLTALATEFKYVVLLVCWLLIYFHNRNFANF